MANVVIVDGRGELDLDRNDTSIVALDDEVDLVLPRRCPEMPHARLGSLCIHANVERDERLEESAEQGSISRDRRKRRLDRRIEKSMHPYAE